MITPDVFFDALRRVFDIYNIDRINIYWLDISPGDKFGAFSELQLSKISYTHKNGKAEELIFAATITKTARIFSKKWRNIYSTILPITSFQIFLFQQNRR